MMNPDATPSSKWNETALRDWVNSKLGKGTDNGSPAASGQRCLQLAGKNVLCVEDKARVNPWLLGGAAVVLLLLVRR